MVCYEDSFSKEPASQGTGIVLSEDGYIATNSHVIGDSRSLYYVEVVTNEGTTYEAKVIGYDSRTDLAVLKINAKGLTPAQFCDSEYVEVGQDVIAVGNPGGIEFQNSLTRGVVSALNRELSLSSQVTYIQTDAAINPGNSGGPLCNMYGQVIGINTAKISSSSYEGMGFAIPSRTVKEIVDDLIAKERLAGLQSYENNKFALEDKIMRAKGILQNSRIISTTEAINLLSDVRWGINLGIIKDINHEQLLSALYSVFPATITKNHTTASAMERDLKRSEILRTMLSGK